MEVHILSWMMDIFFIFTLHILYKQVLGTRFKSRLVLILGWIGCFLAWNLCSYLFADYPFVISISGMVVNFLVLHSLYSGNVRTKIILLFVVIVLGFIAEVIAVFIMSLFEMSITGAEKERNPYWHLGNAASKIFWFIFVKLIACISEKDRKIKIAITEWIEIFTVPIGSLIIIYVVAWNSMFDITLDKLVVFAILLVINLVTYYTYQRVQKHAEELLDSEMLKQQNEYYRLRFEDMEKQWRKLRRIRHDLKNRYIMELEYLKKERYEELRNMYTAELGELQRENKMIESGNIGIDSVLNFKAEAAREAKIIVKHDIRAGADVNMSNGDLNTLFGNLLDNAIEAVVKMPEGQREIDLKLHIDETAILFLIANSFDGRVERNRKGEIVTTKPDKRNHGIGLRAVKEIVDRHKGIMTVETENGRFQVTVFLYME